MKFACLAPLCLLSLALLQACGDQAPRPASRAPAGQHDQQDDDDNSPEEEDDS